MPVTLAGDCSINMVFSWICKYQALVSRSSYYMIYLIFWPQKSLLTRHGKTCDIGIIILLKSRRYIVSFVSPGITNTPIYRSVLHSNTIQAHQ